MSAESVTLTRLNRASSAVCDACSSQAIISAQRRYDDGEWWTRYYCEKHVWLALRFIGVRACFNAQVEAA